MMFIIKLMTSQTCLFTQNRNRIILTFSCKQLFQCTLNLHLKFGAILSQTYKDMTLYKHMYQNVYCNLLQKTSVYRDGLYISVCNSRIYRECFFMFGAILKATNSSFQKGMTFCRSIYVKKVMKLLAIIFEQPSYCAFHWLACGFMQLTAAGCWRTITRFHCHFQV